MYAPRFLDEIADEIDTLENKKDTLFCEQKRIIYLSRCKVFQNYITFSSSLRSNFFLLYFLNLFLNIVINIIFLSTARNQFKRLLIPMLIVLKLFKLKLLLFLPLILGLASFKKFLGFLAIVIPGLIGFFKLYKPFTQTYHPPVYTQSGIAYPYHKENNGYPYPGEHHGPEYPIGYHRDAYGQELAYRGYRDYQS